MLSLILYNQSVKKTGNFLLSNSHFTQNPLYLHLQNQRIKKAIEQYKDKPFSIRIENTNYCNARCFMCPHSTMKRKQGTMSRSLYKKIVDDTASIGIDFINLHNFGEPLIDNDFLWRVKYAKSKGIKKVSTNTNGMLLTPKLSKELIQSGLDELYISIDAATEKTYQKIRIGLNFKIVENNINKLIELKLKNKSSHPKIIVDFLESDLNKKETTQFINKWKGKSDHVCISQLHDWSEKINPTVSKTNFQNYVTFSQAPCRLPFTEMTVNWDGTVSLCCQDIEGEVLIGNLNKSTISEIWQNKKLNKIRQSHLSLDTQKLKLCSKCKLRTFWWTF